MEKLSNFLKIGGDIVPRQKLDGLDYELEPGVIYRIKYDNYSGKLSFSITNPFTLPEKIYETEEDSKLINKVLNHFNMTSAPTTGILLSGIKGSGKTLMAKRIAINSNLPIICIGNDLPPVKLKDLMDIVGDTPICILFDELDKIVERYDESFLLKALDGIDTVGKKLIIFTGNDIDNISDYLQDRCSRVRYNKYFDQLPNGVISTILEDKLNDKQEKKAVFDFITNNMEYATYDNVIAFIDEINENPTDTFEELFNDMNLTKK